MLYHMVSYYITLLYIYFYKYALPFASYVPTQALQGDNLCCKCSSCGTDLINKSATHPSNKGEQQSSYWWGRAGQSLASEAAWLSV